MVIKEYKEFLLDEIINLYKRVGWTNYLEQSENLKKAYSASICTFGAYDSDQLIGIVCAVGDGYTIIFIQDIIVLPEYQRKGVGTRLLEAMIKKYAYIYQIQLLTDNTEETKSFYLSAGFVLSSDINCLSFIKM